MARNGISRLGKAISGGVTAGKVGVGAAKGGISGAKAGETIGGKIGLFERNF